MVECAVDHAIVDEKNLIVTTPAYILGSGIGEVDAGIDELVRGLLGLLATSPIGRA
jgi:enhancing lycopene biosynthesis protein 2